MGKSFALMSGFGSKRRLHAYRQIFVAFVPSISEEVFIGMRNIRDVSDFDPFDKGKAFDGCGNHKIPGGTRTE